MQNVTFAEMEEKIAEGGKIIVDFWAPWCGPCNAMAPILEKFSAENEDIEILKVNVDLNPEITTFGIRGIPTLIAFENGEQKDRMVGLGTPEKIKSLFNSKYEPNDDTPPPRG